MATHTRLYVCLCMLTICVLFTKWTLQKTGYLQMKTKYSNILSHTYWWKQTYKNPHLFHRFLERKKLFLAWMLRKIFKLNLIIVVLNGFLFYYSFRIFFLVLFFFFLKNICFCTPFSFHFLLLVLTVLPSIPLSGCLEFFYFFYLL